MALLHPGQRHQVGIAFLAPRIAQRGRSAAGFFKAGWHHMPLACT
jgi:hypothetical protein